MKEVLIDSTIFPIYTHSTCLFVKVHNYEWISDRPQKAALYRSTRCSQNPINKRYEYSFYVCTYEQELIDWQAPYELGERGRNEIKGKPLKYYLDKLAKVRERTLEEFKVLDDRWLYKEVDWSGHPSNNFFIWFHVYEDEINHRGQIRWLRNRIL
jgi:hypothetical protein